MSSGPQRSQRETCLPKGRQSEIALDRDHDARRAGTRTPDRPVWPFRTIGAALFDDAIGRRLCPAAGVIRGPNDAKATLMCPQLDSGFRALFNPSGRQMKVWPKKAADSSDLPFSQATRRKLAQYRSMFCVSPHEKRAYSPIRQVGARENILKGTQGMLILKRVYALFVQPKGLESPPGALEEGNRDWIKGRKTCISSRGFPGWPPLRFRR